MYLRQYALGALTVRHLGINRWRDLVDVRPTGKCGERCLAQDFRAIENGMRLITRIETMTYFTQSLDHEETLFPTFG